MIKTISTFFSIFLLGQIFAQLPHSYNKNDLNPIAFINTVEQSLNLFYADYVNDKRFDSLINALTYESNDVPTFAEIVDVVRTIQDSFNH